MTVTIEDLTPTIEIVFKKLASSFIKMKTKGRVLFITQDSSIEKDYKVNTYSSSVGIVDVNEQLKQDIIDILDNGVKKVIVFKTKTNIDDVATSIKAQKFDWVFTDIVSGQETVANLAVEMKKFALCYNVAKDSIYVVNFTTPKATLQDDTVIEGVRLLPYAIGIMAGCPYSKSILYKEIDKYKSVELPEELQEATCFYKFDEDLECVKFANGYNSLKTVGENLTEDMKKIAIVECMKRVDVDIRFAFKKSYQGKYKNTRVNQQLFYDAVKYSYFKELAKNGVLDQAYQNDVDTDVAEQRAMWLSSGNTEAQDWDDEKVKDMTFANVVIPEADVKFSDAIEALKMTVRMQ